MSKKTRNRLRFYQNAEQLKIFGKIFGDYELESAILKIIFMGTLTNNFKFRIFAFTPSRIYAVLAYLSHKSFSKRYRGVADS